MQLQQQFDLFLQTHKPKAIATPKGTWEYIKSGAGKETFLLLPGGGSTAEATFKYVIELEKEYTVIIPTLPDHLETVQDGIDGLLAILGAENIQKTHILGFSMGGMLAQVFVRKYPEIVQKLILFVSMLPSKHYAKRYRKYRMGISFFPQWVFKMISKYSTKKQILSEKVPVSTEEKQFWVKLFAWMFDSEKINKRTLISTAKVLEDYFRNYEFTENDLASFSGQILIIEAEKDNVVEENERERLKILYPYAELVTFPNSGHFGFGLFQIDEVFAVIKQFLGK
jgi:aminoacrylate hydrolase